MQLAWFSLKTSSSTQTLNQFAFGPTYSASIDKGSLSMQLLIALLYLVRSLGHAIITYTKQPQYERGKWLPMPVAYNIHALRVDSVGTFYHTIMNLLLLISLPIVKEKKDRCKQFCKGRSCYQLILTCFNNFPSLLKMKEKMRRDN